LGSRTSPFLQEKLIALGCENVFGDVPAIVEQVLGICVSQSQVYRSCQAMSEQLRDEDLNSADEDLKQCLADGSAEVYAMVDGSMLLTDAGWQETKVGRVFQAKLESDAHDMKWTMGASQYVAHRGHYHHFTEQFERLLPSQSACKQIFITDGAVWIGHWLSQRYPNATQILDFFHVCEQVASVASWADRPATWFEKQKKELLNGKVKTVGKAIRALANIPSQEKEKLLCYLTNNAYRMRYDEYRSKGWMIASGPIEAAHRTLLQVRMKRSGQRWANHGCDNMIKLRVARRSQKFSLVTQILKNTAA
jgi:hypothetical protein